MQAPSDFSSPKEWADYYRSIGLAPIPASVSKFPTEDWKEYQNGVPQEIHDLWWQTRSSYSMGFITGEASGRVFVVDLDVKEAVSGIDTWRGWLAVHNNGLDVETYEAKTGSGGRHLYFWVPPGKPMPQTSKNKWKGIDIRGQGGFIMAPPSPHHKQGTRYEWVVAPWEGEIMESPQWLLDEIEKASKASTPTTDGPQPVKTPTPASSFDAFGGLIDGREQKMTDIAFAVVVNARRDSPIRPMLPNKLTEEAYQTYLAARPKTRIQGMDNEAGLEAEGRGRSYMAEKVTRYYEQWDGLIAEKAKERPKKDTGGGLASPPSGGEGESFGKGSPPPPQEDSEPFPATKFTGTAPPRVWLWKDWIPEGIVASLYGDGGVGKSLLAQQLCYALGSGGKFLGPRGFDMPKKKVMAAFCEDDEEELWRRHDDIIKSMGGFSQPFKDVLLWPRVGFDNLLVTFDRHGAPQMTAFFDKLARRALSNRVEFLVLDTAADLFGGNENIRSEVNFFIKSTCGKIIKTAKDAGFVMTILVLAHPSQAGKASGSGESGSTSWNNAVRSRLYITRPEEGLAEQRTLTRMKSNYSASGVDENLELLWNAGILELTGGGAAVFDAKGTANLDTIKAEVYNMVKDAWDRGEPLNSKRGHPRELYNRAKEELTQRGYLKNDIVEAVRRLIDHGEIEQGREAAKRGWKPTFLMRY